MRGLRSLVLLAAAGVFLLGSPLLLPGADDETIKKELAKFQGEWKMVSGVADGFAMPESMVGSCKRVCKGDEVTTTIGEQIIMKAKITIDPTKSPKTIDYQVTDGPTKGKKHLGIYSLERDTFKSCFAAPGAPRPKDFGSKEGDQLTYSVFKRGAESSKQDDKK